MTEANRRPLYRAEDSGDFSHLRHGLSRQMKRYLLLLAGAFLALFSYLLNYAWTTVDEKADQGVEANRKVGLVEKEQEHIKEDLGDLKEGQKTIVKGMQEIVKTLYTLPSERRRNPMPVLEEPPE